MLRRPTLLLVCILSIALPFFLISRPSTASAATATFGNTSIGTATSTPATGYKFGSVYNLGQSGTAVSFSWYTSGGTSAQSMIPVIYTTNASGAPSTLVTEGSQVTVAARQSPGWVTASLPAVSLPAGNYLLGLMSGASGTQVIDYLNPSSNGAYWNQNTYGNPTSAWGVINHENSDYSFYVTYTPALTGSPPANTGLPTISGTVQVGQALSATSGSWSSNPTSFSYQWQHCAATGCTSIVGATTATYTPANSDVGDTLEVTVTATNAGGSTAATSAATSSVQPALQAAPVNQTPPSITGMAQVGQPLTTSLGTWSGNPPPTFTEQWQACQGNACANVSGATASTYTPTAGNIGETIRVIVTGTNVVGSSSVTSAATSVIIAAPVVPAGTFGMTTPGTSTDSSSAGYKFGSIYTLPVSATVTDFKWYVSGGTSSQSFVPVIYGISGGVPTTLLAQGNALTVAAYQAANWVTVALPTTTLQPGNYLLGLLSGPSSAGAKNYYTPAANGSNIWNSNAYPAPSTSWGTDNDGTQQWSFYIDYQTAPSGTVVNVTVPTIVGAAKTGQTLTATTGTWTNSPISYGYQWQDCVNAICTNIAGATKSAYVPVLGDVGADIQVMVTATNSAGSSGEATSGATPVSFGGSCTTAIQNSCSLNIGWLGDSITQGDNGCHESTVGDAVADLQSDGYTVSSSNQGRSGYGTDDWEAGSSTLAAAESSFTAIGVHVVSLMLGTNDARNPAEYAENVAALTPQEHFANMQGIVSSLTSHGFIVILEEPIYTTPGADGLWPTDVNTIYSQYWALDSTLVNNSTVFSGDTLGATVMSQTGDLCTDGVHPSVAGAAVLGRLWANAVEGRDANN